MFSGYVAIVCTLVLWSGFFLSLRNGAQSGLTPADMAIARFALPAMVLFPLVYKTRHRIAQVPKRYLSGMIFGSGLPYLLIAGMGMQLASVAHGSTLIPGILPLFVTAIAVLFFRQPVSSHRLIGLILILLGISQFLLIEGQTLALRGSADHSQLSGYGLFLLGSFMWAVFTISARVANLSPMLSSGFVASASIVMLFVAIYLDWLPSALMQMPISDWPFEELLGHLVVQGLGAGLLATFTYLYAISKLGAERTAAFASTTPIVASILAYFILGEQPDLSTVIAMLSITFGSIIASNVFLAEDRSLAYQPPSFNEKKAAK